MTFLRDVRRIAAEILAEEKRAYDKAFDEAKQYLEPARRAAGERRG